MASRLRRIFWDPPGESALLGDATILTPSGDDQARAVHNGSAGSLWSRFNTSPQPWQDEAWGFFDSLGMFRNAVGWKAGLVSRIRLRAAVKEPGNDEPTIVDNGTAADIVASISAGSQMQIMGNLELQLSVPGDGYLVGIQQGPQITTDIKWEARSRSELRYQPVGGDIGSTVSPWEIVDKTSPVTSLIWVRLPADSIVCRVHRPHPRFKHIADSSSKPALTTMRQVELIQRYLQAHFLSRIASNGVVVFPQEVDFPVRKEFAEMDDAFVREFIELGVEAIKTPGSAAAAMPMPVTVPAEYADKVQHVDFTSRFDLRIIEKWEKAVAQLAVDLDIPPEALTGLAQANHWTGWLIDEDSFKRYIAPDVELLCDALTTGLMHPILQLAGESVANQVMWYDASEIIARPDKSENAKDVYDRGELTGEALRREAGFDEADKPSDEELARVVLYKLATSPQTGFTALKELTGVDVEPPTPAVPNRLPGQPTPPGSEQQPQGPPQQPAEQPPAGKRPAPPAQAAAAAALAPLVDELDALERMARLPHAMRLDGLTGKWQVLHPTDCENRVNACPVTFAQWLRPRMLGPGTSGVYECTLTDAGLRLGHPLTDTDVATMLPTMSRA